MLCLSRETFWPSPRSFFKSFNFSSTLSTSITTDTRDQPKQIGNSVIVKSKKKKNNKSVVFTVSPIESQHTVLLLRPRRHDGVGTRLYKPDEFLSISSLYRSVYQRCHTGKHKCQKEHQNRWHYLENYISFKWLLLQRAENGFKTICLIRWTCIGQIILLVLKMLSKYWIIVLLMVRSQCNGYVW